MTAIPEATDDERAVLGAVLVTDKALRQVTIDAGLRSEHFYPDKHRAIYAAAISLAARKEPVDVLTIWAELERGEGSDGLRKDYLHALAAETPAPGNAVHYARRVVETADLRAKREGALQVLEGVKTEDRSEIQQGIEQMENDLTVEAEPTEPDELFEEFYDFLMSDEKAEIFKLPWPHLNLLCAGGLRRGEVTVLMGHTSHGKSVALDQAMEKFNEQGYKCHIFCTEMSRRERLARYYAAKTGIPYGRIMLKQIDDEQKGEIVKVGKPPFGIRISAGWTVEQICHELVARNVDVAAVDPLHSIAYRDVNDLRHISQSLVRVARRADLTLILVCHVNMGRVRDIVKPFPVLRDIRDSSSIVADADNVLAVHREQDEDGNPVEQGELRFLKVRNGILGGQRVKLTPGRFRFETRGQQPPTP